MEPSARATEDPSNAMPRFPPIVPDKTTESGCTGASLANAKRHSYESDITRKYDPQSRRILSDPGDSGIWGLEKFHREQISPAESIPPTGDEREATETFQRDLQIDFLVNEAGDARQQLERSEKRNAELQQKCHDLMQSANSRSSEPADEKLPNVAEIEALRAENRRLQAEIRKTQAENNGLEGHNRTLRAELSDARGHIFSLQPYTKDLTPEEIRRDYEEVADSITDWMTGLIDPVVENPQRFEEAVGVSRKQPSIHQLREIMYSEDLVAASMWPETDVEVAIAIVMGFVQHHIFQTALAGTMPELEKYLNAIELSMATRVQPTRDLYARRAWRAETVTAILSLPEYQRERQEKAKQLSARLASYFAFLSDAKRIVSLQQGFLQHVIEPCIALHEKMGTSVQHFFLDSNPFVVWDDHGHSFTSPEFFQSIHKLRCENLIQHRKPLNISKMDPRPTEAELSEKLVRIVSFMPALSMRRIGKGDAIKEPTLVRMQQVLVAWGSKESRDNFVEGGKHTLMRKVYLGPPREKTSYTSVLKRPLG